MTPAQLAQTHAAAFTTTRGWSADEFAQLLGSPGAILCGDVRSFVLGRVTLDEAEVLTIATAPAFQRCGLARAALTAFEIAATHAGAQMAFLEVADDNTAAKLLYFNSGFTEVGRRKAYYLGHMGQKTDALVLQKSLRPRPKAAKSITS